MIKAYHFGAYRLVLDSSQIYPDDPGAGTPAMVYAGKASSTYWCAMGEGILAQYSHPYEDIEIPARVMNWLGTMEDKVNEFIEANSPKEVA